MATDTNLESAEFKDVFRSELELILGDHDLKELILASEGEALFIVGRTERAVQFYRSALDSFLPNSTGLAS